MISEKLKQLRKMKNLKQDQVAELVGISQRAISQYEVGTRKPSREVLQKLAELYEVSVDYLLTGVEQDITGFMVPVLGEVRAGVPLYAQENIIDYEEISPNMTGDYFALKIKGDSMAPRILDGDIVIVSMTSDFNSGDLCIVMVDGESATLKRVDIRPTGIMLIPLNASYTPEFYTQEEIKALPVEIIGRVIELRGKL